MSGIMPMCQTGCAAHLQTEVLVLQSDRWWLVVHDKSLAVCLLGVTVPSAWLAPCSSAICGLWLLLMLLLLLQWLICQVL